MQMGDGGLAHVFGSGTSLPDGSALYGLVLHTHGVAVGDFGSGCDPESPEDHMVGNPVVLKNIHIHDLKVKVDQVLRTVIGDGPQVMGPAGDVFQMNMVWNKDTHDYQGNALSDAQVAMQVLLTSTSSSSSSITQEEAKYYFGATNIPKMVLDWVAGETSGATFKSDLVQAGAFKCDGDAMSHHNKGVVGLRLEFQDNVDISDTKIEGLTNIGETDADPYCSAPYQGTPPGRRLAPRRASKLCSVSFVLQDEAAFVIRCFHCVVHAAAENSIIYNTTV